jgi:hypothetical protein
VLDRPETINVVNHLPIDEDTADKIVSLHRD